MTRLLYLLLLAPVAVRAGDMGEPLNTASVPVNQRPPGLDSAGVKQKLGSAVPEDLLFRDEHGKPIRLGDALGGKPVVLTLAYFRCPGLCTYVLNGAVNAMRGIRRDGLELGRDYRAVTVSIDPKEGPRLALGKQRSYLARYGIDSGARAPWRMLTGNEKEIRQLADAVGFGYRYDPRSGQYAHASVVIVLTPKGRVSQYLFGISPSPAALRRALRRASLAQLGTPVAAVLLYCFHYDPSNGTWSIRILHVLRILGAFTLFAMAALLYGLTRKGRPA